MENNSALKFVDYVVDEVNFENVYSTEDNFKLDFDIESNVNFIDDNSFVVQLSVYIFKRAKEVPFRMSLKVTGIFEIDNVNEKLKRELSEKNSVAILFPYVRAIVSNYTAIANVSPLILPPINVVKYIENKKKVKDSNESI